LLLLDTPPRLDRKAMVEIRSVSTIFPAALSPSDLDKNFGDVDRMHNADRMYNVDRMHNVDRLLLYER